MSGLHRWGGADLQVRGLHRLGETGHNRTRIKGRATIGENQLSAIISSMHLILNQEIIASQFNRLPLYPRLYKGPPFF